MKRRVFVVMITIVLFLVLPGCELLQRATVHTFAQAGGSDKPLLPVFEGSEVKYDDNIGFEEFTFVMNENTVKTIERRIHRLFYQAPEGSSPLEIIRYYENSIQDKGTRIGCHTRSKTIGLL